MVSFLFGCSSDTRPKYKNRAYGILIRYPKDWEPKEYVNETVVVFISPLEEELEAFQENSLEKLSPNHIFFLYPLKYSHINVKYRQKPSKI